MSIFDDMDWTDYVGLAVPGAGWLYTGGDLALKEANGGGKDKGILNGVTSAANDIFGAGRNDRSYSPYPYQPQTWGYQGADSDFTRIGLGGMSGTQGMMNTSYGGYTNGYGGLTSENQDLSDNEAMARGYDQAGALQLQREAAMGQAPSAAAYQMQAGLDQSLANQQAMAGGARGQAGLALAGGNAMANSAALQNQAFTNASALRANEMAQARGAYGGLASDVRAGDLQRLGVSNNFTLGQQGNDINFRLGSGNTANGMGNTALGWYNGAQAPYNTTYAGGMRQQEGMGGNYNAAQGNTYGRDTNNAANTGKWVDRGFQAGGMVLSAV